MEYKNDKKNGNYKYYGNGKLLIDYEFLDDELIKGKEYDLYGKVHKEIEENEFIKDYNEEKLIFEGEYLTGKKNGFI